MNQTQSHHWLSPLGNEELKFRSETRLRKCPISGSAGSLGLCLGPRLLCDFSKSLIVFVTFSQFICKKVWTKGFFFFLFKRNNHHKFPPANSKFHIKFQINMNGETGSDSFCIELSTKNTSLRIQWLVEYWFFSQYNWFLTNFEGFDTTLHFMFEFRSTCINKVTFFFAKIFQGFICFPQELQPNLLIFKWSFLKHLSCHLLQIFSFFIC